MKILVTGSAGFIGSTLVETLAKNAEYKIVGIDNICQPWRETKLRRLRRTGIDEPESGVRSRLFPNYTFYLMDLCDREALCNLFKNESFDVVVNLAAQPGVRYSIENPYVYIKSNIEGFLNILECCRHSTSVRHLIYASSSSVYGSSQQQPFTEDLRTDSPESLYAATKKADEAMAYCYSRLYDLPCTGLRFFTVYGPDGREDMAPRIFMRNILEGKPIRVFNHGNMKRDFTYVADIVEGIKRIIEKGPLSRYAIYNIGRGEPIDLMDFINTLEQLLGKTTEHIMEDMQAGDVPLTYADVSSLERDYGYRPHTSLREGLSKMVISYTDSD